MCRHTAGCSCFGSTASVTSNQHQRPATSACISVANHHVENTAAAPAHPQIDHSTSSPTLQPLQHLNPQSLQTSFSQACATNAVTAHLHQSGPKRPSSQKHQRLACRPAAPQHCLEDGSPCQWLHHNQSINTEYTRVTVQSHTMMMRHSMWRLLQCSVPGPLLVSRYRP